MAGMVVEYDTEADAFSARVTDGDVARTAEVSNFVNVDIGTAGQVVGLELLCLPSAVTADERAALATRFPAAALALSEVERLTRLSA